MPIHVCISITYILTNINFVIPNHSNGHWLTLILMWFLCYRLDLVRTSRKTTIFFSFSFRYFKTLRPSYFRWRRYCLSDFPLSWILRCTIIGYTFKHTADLLFQILRSQTPVINGIRTVQWDSMVVK